MTTVAIVGAGQAGSALGHGLARAGHRVVAVASRTRAHAEVLAGEVAAAVMSPTEAAATAEVVLVTVPDGAIGSVVEEISGQLSTGAAVLHCSGVLGLDVLEAAESAGARIGILHPVTPLVEPRDPATLAGKPMGIEAGGAADDTWVRDLVTDLGGRPIPLGGVDRTLYHAGAVVSANLVVGLAGAAERVLVSAGLDGDDAHSIVSSLLASTAGNVSRLGPAAAMTGPVRRGDAAVLARHRAALAALDPELEETYRLVSRQLLDLMEPGPARSAAAAALARTPRGDA